jgi:general secretion pathway protein B
MSSILKALKKLEEEKCARAGESVNIYGGLLRSEPETRKGSRILFPVALVAVASIAVLVTFAMMGGFGGNRSPEKPGAASDLRIQEPGSPQLAPVATPQSSPASSPQLQPRNLPSAVTSLPKTDEAHENNRQQQSVLQDTGSVTESVHKSDPPQNLNIAVPLPAASRPLLKVTGIAWQKDGAGSIAMVNGLGLSIGRIIEGAVVEEIFPDRVRFSHGGSNFEVYLGKSTGDK